MSEVSELHLLFPLSFDKRGCVTCGATPSCPSCKSNEQCAMSIQTCDSCANAYCKKVESASSSGGSKAGPIAGGVVGGLVGVAVLIGFLLWRYVYSAKAKQRIIEKKLEAEQTGFDSGTNDVVTPHLDAEDGYFEKTSRGSRYIPSGGLPGQQSQHLSQQHHPNSSQPRMSTATLSSVNTSLTRGSNIIPIAYIPGVTGRSNDQQPPPMPQHMFSADDILRDSVLTQDGGLRDSIATTNYRGSTAVISDAMMASAQNVKPNLVSVPGAQAAQTVHYGQAQPIYSATRVNAHSIRIPKALSPAAGQPDGQGTLSGGDDKKGTVHSSSTEDSGATMVSIPESSITTMSATSVPAFDTIEEDPNENESQRNSRATARASASAQSPSNARATPTAPVVLDSAASATSAIPTTSAASSTGTFATAINSESGAVAPSDHASYPPTRSKEVVAGNDRISAASAGEIESSAAPDRLRISNYSEFDIPFVIDGAGPSHTVGRKSSAVSMKSRRSQVSRASSRKTGASQRTSAEYVMDDLPFEAYLYAKGLPDDDDKDGRESPFDDRFKLDQD